MNPSINISGRTISQSKKPFIIAEVGINHEGDVRKAFRMIDAAAASGCECVKFQCHITAEEMIPNTVIPGNANESIWEIIDRCTLTEDEENQVRDYTQKKGLIYLCTPFSRAAVERLEKMNVPAYKIGSGECNNLPLLELVAATKKPVILSTGMNDMRSIREAVEVFTRHSVPYALMHCTSVYPTPYDKVRLLALLELMKEFPEAPIGLSDHSIGNYTSFAAVALGASLIEKHFTADKSWPGPDISISLDPDELRDLILGSEAIHMALKSGKTILPEEYVTTQFAYASVVAVTDIPVGAELTSEKIWVKRPGTGGIPAREFSKIIGKKAKRAIAKDEQLSWEDV